MKIAERVLQLLLHDKTAQQIIGCQSRAIGSDPFTASSQKQEAHGSFLTTVALWSMRRINLSDLKTLSKE